MNSGTRRKRRKVERTIRQAVAVICLFLLALCGCALKRAAPALPRPEPGYQAWLANQSMLRQAAGYIAQVSQTERLWLRPGTDSRVDTLLLAAPNWQDCSTASFDKSAKFFNFLEDRLAVLPARGTEGVFLGRITETHEHLLGSGADGLAGSLELDPAFGSPAEYDALIERAAQAGVQLGADLPAAATTRGPDFVLQARHATGYEGIYAMLAVPGNLWLHLPEASSEWDCRPLPEASVKALAEAGLIPAALRRDAMPGSHPAGWASTGEVLGSDGQPRRWVYRYEKSPDNPVLLWQDPAGASRKIFSAAIIARTGLDGITLAGLHVNGWLGLEPTGELAPGLSRFEPGLGAIRDLAAQIHRYGGWCLLADSVAEDLLRQALAAGCDFCRDDVSAALFRQAFLSGNADALAMLLRSRKAERVEEKRLARNLNAMSENLVWLLAEEEAPADFRQIPGERQASLRKAWLVWSAAMPGLFFYDDSSLGGAQNAPAGGQEALDNILKARKLHQLAAGKIYSVSQPSKSTLAVLVELPNGAFWLSAANFGGASENFTIKLPDAFGRMRDAVSGAAPTGAKLDGMQASLFLEGGQTRSIVLLK